MKSAYNWVYSNEVHSRFHLISVLTPRKHRTLEYCIQFVYNVVLMLFNANNWDTRYRSWLRYYATIRKIGGWIPDEVIGFFNWSNHSSRIMTLGSTQPLTEMSTTNPLGGKGRLISEADNLTDICESIV
jgi:hypothetical protein